MSSKCLVFKERARFIRPAALPSAPAISDLRRSPPKFSGQIYPSERIYFHNTTRYLLYPTSNLTLLSTQPYRVSHPHQYPHLLSPSISRNGLNRVHHRLAQGRRARPKGRCQHPREAQWRGSLLQIRLGWCHLLLRHPRSSHTHRCVSLAPRIARLGERSVAD